MIHLLTSRQMMNRALQQLLLSNPQIIHPIAKSRCQSVKSFKTEFHWIYFCQEPRFQFQKEDEIL